MSELSCQNCQAACCKGPIVLDLRLQEAGFMIRGGTTLVTIEQPGLKEQPNAIYPAGYEVDQDDPGTGRWLLEKGRETHPLAADFGRYMMLGACGYLETDENGWEKCSVYEDRPEVCQKFEMGSPTCRFLRLDRGVDDFRTYHRIVEK